MDSTCKGKNGVWEAEEMEHSEDKLNQCKMELIFIERKNIRSKEKSDVTMVKDIMKVIVRCLEERY